MSNTELAVKNEVRAKLIIDGLANGHTYTQIANDLGIHRNQLYALIRKEDMQALMKLEITELETKLKTWLEKNLESPNPANQRAAATELSKMVRHIQDKLYPSLFATMNVNINKDSEDKLFIYKHMWTQTVSRLPPEYRQLYLETYKEVREEELKHHPNLIDI